ncbi:MAG: Bifunctional protein putA [Pseudomonadota bacterium]
MSKTLTDTLNKISEYTFVNEASYIKTINENLHTAISQKTLDNSKLLISKIKEYRGFAVEKLLAKYPLSTKEGVAIIALAEALIRIPDNKTALELLKDKLALKDWNKYLKTLKLDSITLASLGLYLSSKVASFSFKKSTKIISKISEPLLISSVKYAIRIMGKEFVLGEYINEAISRTKKFPNCLFSFDLLGEAARTYSQAETYYSRYISAIDALALAFPNIEGTNIFDRPNLSVKLTALYPRLELLKKDQIKKELLPKLIALVEKVMQHNISVSFDAEEASRLDIYLEVVTEIISYPKFKNFHGIGFVVQAYQKRAFKVLEYIVEIGKKLNKTIPTRLVKGAYWDFEIKNAQAHSLPDYPVFTQKNHTDKNYIACAKYIFSNTENIYPQFATHNAITAATISELSNGKKFEFQKLYGMGNALHKELLNQKNNIRIYAPVGLMDDLLSYLMRRMLENGANSSFVHQITSQSTESLLTQASNKNTSSGKVLPLPYKVFEGRETAIGYELGDKMHIHSLTENLSKFENKIYTVGSIISGKEVLDSRKADDHFRPASYAQRIGSVSHIGPVELEEAINICDRYNQKWAEVPVSDRAKILNKIADLYDENRYEILSLLLREAGKSIKDAIAELQEAIDFCRYYAIQAEEIMSPKTLKSVTGEKNTLILEPRGVFLCISPWNFPLAIFTGQIVAALVAGNTVVAKAADQTSIIANFATKLMLKAGIPKQALQLVISSGSNVGRYLVPNKHVSGIVFTGSTNTAHVINLALAEKKGPIVPFIAETGGQNAMIVDSSALLEQVVDDVIASAFHSAGQRCSSLRILYIQDEIYDSLKQLLVDAIDTLKIGDTTDLTNDIGPVIDKKALETLSEHVKYMKEHKFNILKTHSHNGQKINKDGYYFYPHIIEVSGINDIPGEKFGPILHIAKYKSKRIDKVIDEINNYGFGLTFGIHSRVESKIDDISQKIKVGNVYANRSMIGAQVESQPFGGRGLSGTGFKAGGPNYLMRFVTEKTVSINATAIGGNFELLSS